MIKKMKKIMILGMCAAPFLFASCGGAENSEETTTTDSTAVEVIETVMTSYTIDTATTVINWMNYNGEEVDHQGTVGALSGSFDVSVTGEETVITAANLVVDMNSISEGSEKLEGHLKTEDFFNVNTFATTAFAFDRHENGMIYGTATIIGKPVAVEAPVEVVVENGSATVNVGEFKIDFAQLEMKFFVDEKANPKVKPEEVHNSMIGFSATVKGTATN